jgi:hypothetical protein
MAIIGNALTAPEAGWRRYSDDDSRIKYNGTGWVRWTSDINYSNSLYHYSNILNDECYFRFYGTKFRIIATYVNVYSDNISVYVDGVLVDNFSEYGNSSTNIYKLLVYEKSGLQLGIHEIRIINNIGGKYFGIDGIDIDSNGYLVHPTLEQVDSFSKLKVGKCLPCRFNAGSPGSPGFINEIGTCIADEIPVTGVSSGNGLFYLIKTDRGTVIADRVLQTNITWDSINIMRLINGVDIITSNGLINPTSDVMTDYTITGNFPEYTDAYVDAKLYYVFSTLSSMDNPSALTKCLYNKAVSGQFYVNIHFNQPKLIKYIYMQGLPYGTVSINQCGAKGYKIEGSNDGVNYVTLCDSNDAIYTTPTMADLNNNISYSNYKITFKGSNHTDYGMSIGRIKLFDTLPSKYDKFNIRSMAGGTSYLNTDGTSTLTNKNLGAYPADNEWDKYIKKSTLNGKIIAGDDSIWHYRKLYSWCKESTLVGSWNDGLGNVVTTISSYKIARGYDDDTAWKDVTFGTPNSASNITGFRPIITYGEIPKFLMNDNGQFKCIQSGLLAQFTDNKYVESDYDSRASTNPGDFLAFNIYPFKLRKL